jgi:hypothetical protein
MVKVFLQTRSVSIKRLRVCPGTARGMSYLLLPPGHGLVLSRRVSVETEG